MKILLIFFDNCIVSIDGIRIFGMTADVSCACQKLPWVQLSAGGAAWRRRFTKPAARRGVVGVVKMLFYNSQVWPSRSRHHRCIRVLRLAIIFLSFRFFYCFLICL